MSSPIKPLADRVVVVREEAKKKTASGIYLPEAAKEQAATCEVKAIGPDVKHVKVGDKVVYGGYNVTELKIDGVEYLIIKEEDIVAKL